MNRLNEGINPLPRFEEPYPLNQLWVDNNKIKYNKYELNIDNHLDQVPTTSLISNQYYIDDDKVNNLIQNKNNDDLPPPIVVEYDDKFIVLDGNHRLAAAIKRGEDKINCLIYKFEDVEEAYYDKLNELESNQLIEGYLDDEEEFYDYGTEEVKGTDIFDINKGESSYAREMLKLAKTGGVNEKGLGAEIVQMTPREYMTQVAKGFDSTFDKQIKQMEYDKGIINNLKQVITKYKRKFPITYLNVDSKYGNFEQEGRHRMYTAGELFGWDTKFPVLKIFEKDKEKANKIKQKALEEKIWKYLLRAVRESQKYHYKDIDEVKSQLEYDIERELDDVYDYKRLAFSEDLENQKLHLFLDGKEWMSLDLTEFDIDPNKEDINIEDYDLSDEEIAQIEKELGIKFDESLNKNSYLSKLTPAYEYESRVEYYMDKIKKGYNRPILVDKDNIYRIIDGNHSFEAYRRLGLTPKIYKTDRLDFLRNVVESGLSDVDYINKLIKDGKAVPVKESLNEVSNENSAVIKAIVFESNDEPKFDIFDFEDFDLEGVYKLENNHYIAFETRFKNSPLGLGLIHQDIKDDYIKKYFPNYDEKEHKEVNLEIDNFLGEINKYYSLENLDKTIFSKYGPKILKAINKFFR